MKPRVSIVLVGERPEQLTGGGCCGKLEGDNALLGERPLFEQSLQGRQALGVLYRTVHRFFADALRRGELVIDVVDPRNQLYLVPRLWRDVWRYRPGWAAGLRSILQWFALPAVIVNGAVFSRGGQVSDPDSLCHFIAARLGEPLECR